MSQRRFWGASLLLLFVFVQSACAGQTMVEDAAETRTRTAVAALPTASPPPLSPTGEANADVRFVEARQDAGGSWTFTVTVAHPDQGWEDYADGWDIVLPDGSVVKPDPDSPFTRLLLHPHETEQPFTRSLGGIVIPEGVTTVTVRAHDLVDGFGGQEIQVDLTADSGPGFEVQR